MDLNKRKFILALVVIFTIGILFSVGIHIFVEYVKKEQRAIFINNIGIIENILKADINFLKARKAEKNLIIFKDLGYKEQVMFYIKQAKANILKMKFFSQDRQDVEMVTLLENNIADYDKLFEGLLVMMNLDTPDEIGIKTISDKMAHVNDIFAENVEVVLQMQSIQIEQKRAALVKYFTLLKNVLIILLPVIIILGYLVGNLIFCFDVL